MRLPPILLILCLAGCSLAKKGPEEAATPTNTQIPTPTTLAPPPAQEPKQPATPATNDQRLPAMPVLEDPAWTTQEDPGRAWDETDPVPEVEEARKGLFETLTSNYGVRLPRSNSRSSLEAAIGIDNWSVEFDRSRAAGARVFAREIIVGISKSDIFVNDFLVVSVTCSTPEGGPCPDTFESDRNDLRYQVAPEMLGRSADEAFVITPLLKQLQDLQRIRREVLHGMDEAAAAWLMDCDVFTLAADRTIPFDLLAKVIHTAGFADLTRVRLATLDDDNNLTYVPILAPRLDHGQRKVEHLVGDGWWQRQQREPDEGFAFAYLNYSASPYPETFAAAQFSELPSCLPAGVAWQKIIEDPEFARITEDQVISYINEARVAQAQLLGLTESPLPPVGLVAPPGPEGTLGVPALPNSDEDEDLSAGTVDGAIDGFPASRVLVEEDPDSLADSGSDVVAADDVDADLSEKVDTIALRPFAFVGRDEFVVALRSPEGPLFQAVAVPRSDPDRLYDFLAASQGWALGVSAQLSLPTEELVGALDTLRYRCLVHTMSGKCKRWEPVLPHLYLFLPPGNRFAPLPPPKTKARATVAEPSPVALPTPLPAHEEPLAAPAAVPIEGDPVPADSPLLP
jgi:hypothetical protein